MLKAKKKIRKEAVTKGWAIQHENGEVTQVFVNENVATRTYRRDYNPDAWSIVPVLITENKP